MNRIAVAGAVALALGTAPVAAQAQDATPLESLSQEQKDHGVETFKLLASAMQSDKVPESVKSVLMACMYENSVGKISETVDKVIAANPGKIDRAKPEQMVGVIAQVCGYKPDQSKAAEAPAKNAPAHSSAKPKGR